MDLIRYINAMREFREREGDFPDFGKSSEQRNPKGHEEAKQPTQQRLVLGRRRRRAWK